MKTNADVNLENLEQFDSIDTEIFEKYLDKYAPLIGSFLMKFSCLEHELNIAIADTLEDDYHRTGYIITEHLTTYNKIDLFYKLNLAYALSNEPSKKSDFINLIERLKSINEFRNSIVHANWQTLTKKGFVRTKILMDKEEGWVKFKNIQITPKIIKDRIREIDSLIEEVMPVNFMQT